MDELAGVGDPHRPGNRQVVDVARRVADHVLDAVLRHEHLHAAEGGRARLAQRDREAEDLLPVGGHHHAFGGAVDLADVGRSGGHVQGQAVVERQAGPGALALDRQVEMDRGVCRPVVPQPVVRLDRVPLVDGRLLEVPGALCR